MDDDTYSRYLEAMRRLHNNHPYWADFPGQYYIPDYLRDSDSPYAICLIELAIPTYAIISQTKFISNLIETKKHIFDLVTSPNRYPEEAVDFVIKILADVLKIQCVLKVNDLTDIIILNAEIPGENRAVYQQHVSIHFSIRDPKPDTTGETLLSTLPIDHINPDEIYYCRWFIEKIPSLYEKMRNINIYQSYIRSPTGGSSPFELIYTFKKSGKYRISVTVIFKSFHNAYAEKVFSYRKHSKRRINREWRKHRNGRVDGWDELG